MGMKGLPRDTLRKIEEEGVEGARVPGDVAETWVPLPAGCTEADYLERIIEYARSHGWLVAHFRPARVKRGGEETYETPVAADGKGFPDLVMLRDGQIVVIEAKRNAKLKPRPDQQRWLKAWQKVPGAIVRVASPETWSEVQKVLS
jgi:hypothetical protein